MSTPHVIVLGNEKGGSGKSTTAVHVAVALSRDGYRVGVLDLDGRQKSTARYLENRQTYARKHGLDLVHPVVMVLTDETEAADPGRFAEAFEALAADVDMVVIDCPGRDSALSRAAHARADTLITPMNDSFVDLDLLATIDADSFRVVRASFYSELVWKCRQERAKADGGRVDWVVLRTRLSQLEARNKARVSAALDELSKRIGFRVLPGLSERVVFRELFLKGLTLLDLKDAPDTRDQLSMSHLAARQELRDLMTALKLPQLIQSPLPTAAA
jgi:chromosome partitioning protein